MSSSVSRVARSKGTSSIENLHTYLRLLGYREDKHVKVLDNLSVFEHPSQPEFVRVMRFLLGLVDENEAETQFRHCFPPLDKKHEAEFRKKAFKWYKNLQMENPELVLITASFFLSPGGPKFINFLMIFVRWIALNSIRSRSAKLDEELLSSPFLSSKEMSHSLKKSYLKFKANEFKSQGCILHKSTDELLEKGKEYTKELSFKYRVKKSWLDSNKTEVNPDYLEELIVQRKELEEKVHVVSSQMNGLLKRLDVDMTSIEFLQNQPKSVETLDISPCLQKCATLEEYIALVSKELSSEYDSTHIQSSWEKTRQVSDAATNLHTKVDKFSQKITKVLLNLNQEIIPKNALEVNNMLRTWSQTIRSAEESEKCLLPPTPYVDIKVITHNQYPSNLDPHTYGSPLHTSSSNKPSKEEDGDTPTSRHTTSRLFPKRDSPIINLKSESNIFYHLEDSGSSVSDLRCISTFSPVLSSSRMMNTIEARECISPTSRIENNTKMEYSDFTSAIIERYKKLKLRSNHLGIHSTSTSPSHRPSVVGGEKVFSMNEEGGDKKSSRILAPQSPNNRCEMINQHSKSSIISLAYQSPFLSPFDSPGQMGRRVSGNFYTESKRISKIEDLIETLGGNENLPMSLSSLKKEGTMEKLEKNCILDSLKNLRRQSMGEDENTPISFNNNSFCLSNLENPSGKNLSSESFIGSRLEGLIETLGGNEEVNYLLDSIELPNFEL